MTTSHPDWQLAAPTRRMIPDLNALSARLFAALARSDANLVLSPYSYAVLLGLLLEGTRGETARQIEAALFPSGTPADISAAIADLRTKTRTGGIDYEMANGLWVADAFELLEPFMATLRKDYACHVDRQDFNDPDRVCATINAWVKQRTRGLITDLINPRDLDALTRLVAVNACYFFGEWENKFRKEDTAPHPFHLSPDEQVDVDMMSMRGFQMTASVECAQLVELPFRRNSYEEIPCEPRFPGDLDAVEYVDRPELASDFSILIILPDTTQDLSDLVQSPDRLTRIINARREFTDCRFYLPRFQLASFLRLTEASKSLGVKSLFSEAADFGHATDDPEGLLVSDIIQQARIRIDEEGAEMAAATAVVAVGAAALIDDPTEIRVDRPFVFALQDTGTGLVHFIGRVTDPRQSD